MRPRTRTVGSQMRSSSVILVGSDALGEGFAGHGCADFVGERGDEFCVGGHGGGDHRELAVDMPLKNLVDQSEDFFFVVLGYGG